MKDKGLEFIRTLDRISNLDHEYLVKHESETDERYGCIPYARSIEQHIRSGLIILDKPPGPTSHEVVAWIKNMFELGKAGHGGTLEPSLLRGWAGKPQGNRSPPNSLREGYKSYRDFDPLLQGVCSAYGAALLCR